MKNVKYIIAIAAIATLTFVGFSSFVAASSNVSVQGNVPAVIKKAYINDMLLSVLIGVNTSPFVGKEGYKVSAQMIKERLFEEARTNPTIQVKGTNNPDCFEVRGESELQLVNLIEKMRSEGFELTVSDLQVLYKRDANGTVTEPYEEVIADVPAYISDKVLESLQQRNGTLIKTSDLGGDKTQLIFHVPSRFLLGYTPHFAKITEGNGELVRKILKYGDVVTTATANRNGVFISSVVGKATAFTIFGFQDRGVFFIRPQDNLYVGMILGEHNRAIDLEVNLITANTQQMKAASGNDAPINLIPPRTMNLGEMMTYIKVDESIEVTSKSLRLRKQILDATERKKQNGMTSSKRFLD